MAETGFAVLCDDAKVGRADVFTQDPASDRFRGCSLEELRAIGTWIQPAGKPSRSRPSASDVDSHRRSPRAPEFG
jgi:hypothetical protein